MKLRSLFATLALCTGLVSAVSAKTVVEIAIGSPDHTTLVAAVETDGAVDSEDGWYHQTALQVGAYYTFDFGLQLGADLGVSWFYASVDREVIPGIERNFSYTGGGAVFNLTAGYRF